MRIFINSADTNVLYTALHSGYVYGVTTNPTVLRAAGVYVRQVPPLVQQMIEWGAREVHLQTYATTTSEMVSEGRMLSALDNARVVVRIPGTPAGFAAAAQLIQQNIQVEIVAVYTLRQALAAHSIGASYIAVYLGRMRDTGIDGLTQIGKMQQMLEAQKSSVKILAGSIRDAEQLDTLGMQGIQAATIPATVIDDILISPATDSAVDGFRKDAEAILDPTAGVGGH